MRYYTVSTIILKGINDMPLVKGQAARTKKGFQQNIKAERKSGKKLDQSVAIAYGEADAAKRKAARKKKKSIKK